MDINKFTEKAREAVTQAQSIAVGMGHQDIDSEHLALALIRQEQGIVPRILDQMGVQTAALAVAVEEHHGQASGVLRDLIEHVGVVHMGSGALPGGVVVGHIEGAVGFNHRAAGGEDALLGDDQGVGVRGRSGLLGLSGFAGGCIGGVSPGASCQQREG